MIIEEKQTTTVVDSATGEVLSSNVEQLNISITKNVKRENFIQVYLQDVSGFLKIENGTQIQLLALIWKEVSYNNPVVNEGNSIVILRDTKERWSKDLNISIRTIENALTSLVKKNLIQKLCKGKYRLNPAYYFKGSTTEREKILNLTTKYEIEPNEEFENEGGNK